MSLFDRFRRKRRGAPAGNIPTGKSLGELKDFMATRQGVEAYVEPPTSVYAMSLCLVAADGEYLRRSVKDGEQARKLCSERGIPLYDARIVGYPRRMREYPQGARPAGISLDDLPPLETTSEPEGRED